MTSKIDRRSAIKAGAGVAAAAMTGIAGLRAAIAQTSANGAGGVAHPIVLYCDLKVDPKREQEMLTHFHTKFKPAGAKHKGFIDLKMLKLRSEIQGYKLPEGIKYRFQLTYQNEELRQDWIHSKVHADLWPGIENTLLDKNFHVSLFDDV